MYAIIFTVYLLHIKSRCQCAKPQDLPSQYVVTTNTAMQLHFDHHHLLSKGGDGSRDLTNLGWHVCELADKIEIVVAFSGLKVGGRVSQNFLKGL